MAHPSLNPHTHHLPYRPTTTILLEDPPYLSLSGNDDAGGGAGASSLCGSHGENVRCDKCNGGREDVIVINEIGGGGGSVVLLGIRESGDDVCDSDDSDEGEDEAGEGVVGWANRGGSGSALLPYSLAGNFTALPPSLGGCSLGSVSAGMASEDSVMADGVNDTTMGYDSGYESANRDERESCQLVDSDTNPGDRCCESPVSDARGGDDGGDYGALYQQLKTPVERVCGGWQGWVSPGEVSSPCESDEEMLGKGTGHSSMVVTAQREARGHMQRSGGKGLMGGGQKMGKVRKAGGGGKQALRRCGGGHAGVPWVS